MPALWSAYIPCDFIIVADRFFIFFTLNGNLVHEVVEERTEETEVQQWMATWIVYLFNSRLKH